MVVETGEEEAERLVEAAGGDCCADILQFFVELEFRQLADTQLVDVVIDEVEPLVVSRAFVEIEIQAEHIVDGVFHGVELHLVGDGDFFGGLVIVEQFGHELVFADGVERLGIVRLSPNVFGGDGLVAGLAHLVFGIGAELLDTMQVFIVEILVGHPHDIGLGHLVHLFDVVDEEVERQAVAECFYQHVSPFADAFHARFQFLVVGAFELVEHVF